MATSSKKALPDLPSSEDHEERIASDALVVGIGASDELQSPYTKLLALNADLETKIRTEVNMINGDLHNLMDATQIATIFLDHNLRVKRYSPQVQEIFEVGETGVGLTAHRAFASLGFGKRRR